jgi:hypothetical protein
VLWVISVYFNIRNTLPKSDTFLLGHPVCDEVSFRNIKCEFASKNSDFSILLVTGYLAGGYSVGSCLQLCSPIDAGVAGPTLEPWGLVCMAIGFKSFRTVLEFIKSESDVME